MTQVDDMTPAQMRAAVERVLDVVDFAMSVPAPDQPHWDGCERHPGHGWCLATLIRLEILLPRHYEDRP